MPISKLFRKLQAIVAQLFTRRPCELILREQQYGMIVRKNGVCYYLLCSVHGEEEEQLSCLKPVEEITVLEFDKLSDDYSEERLCQRVRLLNRREARKPGNSASVAPTTV